MKKKIILSIALGLSLLTMLLPWFGGVKGVQEVYGILLLENPIAFACMILAFAGIWTNYGRNSEIIGSIGLLGILVMEIYEFLTWHILTITGEFSLSLSLDLCYPEFWIAVLCSIATLSLYKLMNNKHLTL